jgi:hypothetical protein
VSLFNVEDAKNVICLKTLETLFYVSYAESVRIFFALLGDKSVS